MVYLKHVLLFGALLTSASAAAIPPHRRGSNSIQAPSAAADQAEEAGKATAAPVPSPSPTEKAGKIEDKAGKKDDKAGKYDEKKAGKEGEKKAGKEGEKKGGKKGEEEGKKGGKKDEKAGKKDKADKAGKKEKDDKKNKDGKNEMGGGKKMEDGKKAPPPPPPTAAASEGATATGTGEAEATGTNAPPPPPPPPAGNGAVGDAAAAGTATKGLLALFTVADTFSNGAATGAAAAVDFLTAAVPAIQKEAGTLSWFGAQTTDAQNATTDTFVVFDTFADDAGRAAHLAGSVAGSLVAQTPNFSGGLGIDAFDILALKAADGAQGAGVTVGLHAAFEAKSDQIAEVQKLCTDSLQLAEAEQGTVNWLCAQVASTPRFLILDSFADDAGRQAHLDGEIAKKLFAAAPELLVADPTITLFNIVAATVQGGADNNNENVAGGGAAEPPSAVAPPTISTQSVTNTATIGLLVPFSAVQGAGDAVQSFVSGATELAAAEPGTLQWFGGRFENETKADSFLVFDTFATAADREAHLAGKVASGLLGQIASLSEVDIIPFDIFAIKSLNDEAATGSATAGVTLGLQVLFNASNAAAVPEVEQLCRSGLEQIDQEAGTLNWICGQLTGTQTFVILDSFATENDREAHLNGEFVKSLLAAVGTTIDTPDVQKIEIVAGTSKPEGAAQQGAGGENQNQNDGEATATATGDAPTETGNATETGNTETGSATETGNTETETETGTGTETKTETGTGAETKTETGAPAANETIKPQTAPSAKTVGVPSASASTPAAPSGGLVKII